jgi:multidrug efflux pump subunit AcrB
LSRHYERVLKYLLGHKGPVIFSAAGLILLGFLLYRSLATGFLPEMDEGTFILDYWTAPGTSLEETNRVMKQIESVITATPEVVSYSRRTGLQLGGGLTEANSGDFLVRLKENRSRGMEEIIDEVREKVLANVPGVEIEFAQLMGDLIGDLTAVPQPIEIKVFGDDFEQIHQVSQKVAQEIETIPGVVDVYNGVTIAGSSLNLTVDPMRAGLYGLNAETIQREAEAALNGMVASQVQSGQVMTGIRVLFPAEAHSTLEKLKRLRFLSPHGNYVSLASVADISIQEGQPELTRDNLKQMIAVTARLSSGDLGGTMKKVQAVLQKNVPLPQNVYIQYGGLYQEQQKSFLGLAIVMMMAILLLFIVQLIEFESFRIPLVILSVSILSMFGVFFLLWITRTALNISSMMGMIMIVGIVAENAIFLMHYLQKLVGQGLPVEAAVVQAGMIRLRPIIMTTLAAVLALLPLALGFGVGAQMQQPLALAVIGGFSFSAFLLLLFLPVFYVAVSKTKKVND